MADAKTKPSADEFGIPLTVDPVIVDLINQAQHAVLGQETVLTSCAGKAYRSVAQSSAIAIQDATDALRNISTIATTALGVAMAEMLAGNPAGPATIDAALATMTQATKNYVAIGEAAAAVLKGFPSG